MQPAHPTKQNRRTGLAVASAIRQDNGFFEIAILSLAALTAAIFTLANDFGVGAFQLALTLW